MRVTNNMLVWNMLGNLNSNLEKMAEYQNQVASGQSINKASDDPIGTTKVLQYKTDISENELFEDNATSARGYLEVSETAISDVKDILQRIRELTVQGANETNTAEDTSQIALEIDSLMEEIIVLGNSSIAGRQIFSGLEIDQKLFNEDGTYNLDFTAEELEEKTTLEFQIAVGEYIDACSWPTDIFGFVEADTFTTRNIESLDGETAKATRSKISGEFDLNMDYTNDGMDNEDLNIVFNGQIFNVDESNLDGSYEAIDKSDVLSAFLNAESGSSQLSDYASVYFDTNGELVIEAKEYGSNAEIVGPISTGYNPVFTSGIDVADTEATYSTLNGVIDLNTDYSSETLDISIDGMVYDVDESMFSSTPLSDAEIQLALETASNGGVALSTVASVSVSNGEIKIESLTSGQVSMSGPLISPELTVASGAFDLTMDYSGETLDFTIDGNLYRVNENLLSPPNSTLPHSEQDVIDALSSAKSDDGTYLNEIVNISFDGSGNLNLESKSFGLMDIVAPTSTGYSPLVTDGTDGFQMASQTGKLASAASPSLILGGSAIANDSEILAETDSQSLIVKINGEDTKITIDMSTVNTVDEYVAALQVQMDNIVSPAGTISVTGTDGSPIGYEIKGTNDGETLEFEIDAVAGSESQMLSDLTALSDAMKAGDTDFINESLDTLDYHINVVLSEMGSIGGITSRLTYIESRIADSELSFTSMLSEVQDADMAEVITKLTSLENIYNASLSVGSQVIQLSLVDYM